MMLRFGAVTIARATLRTSKSDAMQKWPCKIELWVFLCFVYVQTNVR